MFKPYFHILFIEYSSFTPTEKILFILMGCLIICVCGLAIFRIRDSKPQKLTPGIYIFNSEDKDGNLYLSRYFNGKLFKGLYKNQKNLKWVDEAKDGYTYILEKQNNTYYFILHEELIIHS